MKRQMVFVGLLVSLMLLITGVISASAKGLSAPLAATCSPATNKLMRGSYLVNIPGASNRVYYEVKYSVKSDCTVYNIQDRVAYSGQSYSEVGVSWFKTCINASSACTNRSVTWIDVNTNKSKGKWTAWKIASGTSSIGKEYRNYSGLGNGSAMSYGYTYFK